MYWEFKLEIYHSFNLLSLSSKFTLHYVACYTGTYFPLQASMMSSFVIEGAKGVLEQERNSASWFWCVVWAVFCGTKWPATQGTSLWMISLALF